MRLIGHFTKATKRSYYLEAGAVMLRDIQKFCRTSCGYAGLRDVLHKRHSNRMESFFLGETVKYLYLLFDEGLPSSYVGIDGSLADGRLDHWINHVDSNMVFTTGE
jgi:hypothetical protein